MQPTAYGRSPRAVREAAAHREGLGAAGGAEPTVHIGPTPAAAELAKQRAAQKELTPFEKGAGLSDDEIQAAYTAAREAAGQAAAAPAPVALALDALRAKAHAAHAQAAAAPAALAASLTESVTAHLGSIPQAALAALVVPVQSTHVVSIAPGAAPGAGDAEPLAPAWPRARGGRLRLRCMSYKEGATSHGGAVESSRRRSVLFISDSAYEMC